MAELFKKAIAALQREPLLPQNYPDPLPVPITNFDVNWETHLAITMTPIPSSSPKPSRETLAKDELWTKKILTMRGADLDLKVRARPEPAEPQGSFKDQDRGQGQRYEIPSAFAQHGDFISEPKTFSRALRGEVMSPDLFILYPGSPTPTWESLWGKIQHISEDFKTAARLTLTCSGQYPRPVQESLINGLLVFVRLDINLVVIGRLRAWYRGRIECQISPNDYVVWILDVGVLRKVKFGKIAYFPKRFMSIPPLAQKCKLFFGKDGPSGEVKWTQQDLAKFEQLLSPNMSVSVTPASYQSTPDGVREVKLKIYRGVFPDGMPVNIAKELLYELKMDEDKENTGSGQMRKESLNM